MSAIFGQFLFEVVEKVYRWVSKLQGRFPRRFWKQALSKIEKQKRQFEFLIMHISKLCMEIILEILRNVIEPCQDHINY